MMIQRVVIVGAGAIGGTIGGMLCNAGSEVLLVARGPHGQAIRDDGLTIRFPNRTVVTRPECVASVNQVEWRKGDICLVATKLNDAESLMDELVLAAGEDLPIVCGFNGVQGEKWATQRFDIVATIMIWMPSTHLHPGDVRVYSQQAPGILDIGPIKGTYSTQICEQMSRVFCKVGFDSKVQANILSWKHAKWITNVGNTAQALIEDDWKSVAKAAQIEAENVLTASKVERIETSQLLDRCENIRLKPIDGEDRPGGSTWQSFQRGRPLETPWIEGAIARLAELVGVAAPINRRLAELALQGKTAKASEVLI